MKNYHHVIYMLWEGPLNECTEKSIGAKVLLLSYHALTFFLVSSAECTGILI